MQLHQLFRMIPNNIPVVLFDISPTEIFRGLTKSDIPFQFYEDEVFLISAGPYPTNKEISSLHIMLKK